MKKKTLTKKKPQTKKRTISKVPGRFKLCLNEECSISTPCTRENIEEYLERMAWT